MPKCHERPRSEISKLDWLLNLLLQLQLIHNNVHPASASNSLSREKVENILSHKLQWYKVTNKVPEISSYSLCYPEVSIRAQSTQQLLLKIQTATLPFNNQVQRYGQIQKISALFSAFYPTTQPTYKGLEMISNSLAWMGTGTNHLVNFCLCRLFSTLEINLTIF